MNSVSQIARKTVGDFPHAEGSKPVKPAPEIEMCFSQLEDAQERLMKSISQLVSKIHSVCRGEEPPANKVGTEERAQRMVPLAERIQKITDTLNHLGTVLDATTDRVEL